MPRRELLAFGVCERTVWLDGNVLRLQILIDRCARSKNATVFSSPREN